MLADLGLLVGRNLQPVLGNERTGLYGRELAQILVLMASADLDEEDKGFGLVVEFLLQDSGGLLKVSLGGYMKGSARRTWASTLQDELTIQDNLQLLQESLLIHDGRGNMEDFRVILFSFNGFSCPRSLSETQATGTKIEQSVSDKQLKGGITKQY